MTKLLGRLCHCMRVADSELEWILPRVESLHILWVMLNLGNHFCVGSLKYCTDNSVFLWFKRTVLI